MLGSIWRVWIYVSHLAMSLPEIHTHTGPHPAWESGLLGRDLELRTLKNNPSDRDGNHWSRYNDQIGNMFVQKYPQSYIWEGVGTISRLDSFIHSLISLVLHIY